MIPPVIQTARLVLRPLKATDAQSHMRYINDWEVTRWLGPGFPWPYPADGSEKYLARNSTDAAESLHWAITFPEKAGDALIGVIELRPNETEGQRGFWLARDFHNLGVMTEAIYATNDYWFDTMGRDTLHLCNAKQNGASSRLKEKSGATLLAVRPGKFLDPALTEEETWLLTAENWRHFRQNHPLPSPPAAS
jgi:[ribosomal protein S5]-alanine N-acetyltransferase